jgi:chromosome segregation ATPase
MNNFGKVCVVFVTAASLGFVAFAGAMRSGGRNWMAEASDLGPDYALAITTGDKTNYGITYRKTNQSVSNSPILAEAVVAAKGKQVSEAREEMAKLNKMADDLKPVSEAAVKAVAEDEKGLKLREQALMKQLEELTQEITRINGQIIEAANEAQKIRVEGQERREEVYRLRNQLELLRNDLSVAKLQRKNLEEEEVRLREVLDRLERRQRQLAGEKDDSGYNQEKSSTDR